MSTKVYYWNIISLSPNFIKDNHNKTNLFAKKVKFQ